MNLHYIYKKEKDARFELELRLCTESKILKRTERSFEEAKSQLDVEILANKQHEQNAKTLAEKLRISCESSELAQNTLKDVQSNLNW